MYVVFRYLVDHILAWSTGEDVIIRNLVSRVCHVSSHVPVTIKSNSDKEPKFLQ